MHALPPSPPAVCATVARCRAQAAHLVAALRWQQKDRARLRRALRVRFHRDESYAIALAARSFSLPESQLRRVAGCESTGDSTGRQLNARAKNSRSSAAGLFQFLDVTWSATPFATRFSVYDPVANALAAAQIISHEGYGQWSCKWAA